MAVIRVTATLVSKTLMVSVLILTNTLRRTVTYMGHVSMHQVLTHVLVKRVMKVMDSFVRILTNVLLIYAQRNLNASIIKVFTHANVNLYTSWMATTHASTSMNVLMERRVIQRLYLARTKMVDSNVNASMISKKTPSNHLAVNVMMDMKVMKWINVPAEFIVVIPWLLVLLRVQHSDANVDPVMMVLAHIAVISINVNTIHVKTDNTVSTVQVALTVPVDVVIEQQTNQPIRIATILISVYLV